MFNFFKKTPQNIKSLPADATHQALQAGLISNLKLSLSGLHCSSCAVNIDLTLEDLDGVSNSETNYARSIAVIDFDPKKVDTEKIIAEINKLGYQAKPKPKSED